MQSSAAIRQSFIDFFVAKGHQHLASSSLVPAKDPSLLFTNAGMVQFKDVFLGNEPRPAPSAVTSQRCVRAGGKHNDLENVGYTARHHTFFEMLGNFSFADYAKQEAIDYAWEYLVDVLKLPEDRLWVTVYQDDSESEDIWLNKVGVDASRFARLDEADNFWAMGDIGPCGPCTEIYYDHGDQVAGTPPNTPGGAEGDRYVEIWNLVFMQYERDDQGRQTDLPKLSVDTGMGLERLAAVLQGVNDNYDIDLFQHLIHRAAEVTGCPQHDNSSLKVIADHIRSSAFLITDGVLPANEGRGYVLRRIIRRALRHGHKLNVTEPFFYEMVETLEAEMGQAFPELTQAKDKVTTALKAEEEKFAETLTTGMSLLEEAIASMSSNQLDGEVIFKLYDTYGFPVDLTADIARERGFTLDMKGFDVCMNQQKERARSHTGFSASAAQAHPIDSDEHHFSGYETTDDKAKVVALFADDIPVEQLKAGSAGIVVLDNTPFYAESGGQIGDSGSLRGDSGLFEVSDTQKQGIHHKHFGQLKECALSIGDQVTASVDHRRRHAIMRNHSATHLMHAALREVLGDHVEQKGSLVAEDRLRFDFSHNAALSEEDIARIEQRVNQQILDNTETKVHWAPKDEAIKQGAMALFGEKYDDTVRVLTMGDDSVELCGGTHVERSGDIGLFKIVQQSNVASGVRRIEAVTGQNALAYVADLQQDVEKLCALLNAPRDTLYSKIEQLFTQFKGLKKDIKALSKEANVLDTSTLVQQATDVDGIKVLATKLENANKDAMRSLLDQLKQQLKSAIIVLAAVNEGRVVLLAGVTDDLTDRFKANDILNQVAQPIGGKGGGRATMAEGGGQDGPALEGALAGVTEQVRASLAAH